MTFCERNKEIAVAVVYCSVERETPETVDIAET